MSGGPERDEFRRRRRLRNWAIAGVLAALVVLFYVIALVRMGGSPQ